MGNKGRGATRHAVGLDDMFEREPKTKNDPAEIRIYIKQLKRALRFLPIGSRAYYYLEGELVRANKSLKALVADGSSLKDPGNEPRIG